MRTLLARFKHLSIITLTLLAVACGGGTTSDEKVLRVANYGEPESMDPHMVTGTWTHRILGEMFMGLTTEAADGSTVAGAAESWEISDDGTVYTFTIRDHTWSDGTPVTADDFVFSLRRILLPETAAEYASLLYPIKNAEAANNGSASIETIGVRAVDASTFEVTLNAPTPYFLTQLTHYTAWPVPKHIVEKHGNAWSKQDNIVVNGSYLLDDWAPSTHVKLVKNPKFYDADSLNIDRIVFYPGEDRVAGQKRFRAGEVDLATDFSSDQIDWLKENLADETRISPYLGVYYYPINTSKAPFTDPRIRQALSMSIDRDAIAYQVLKSGEIPAYSFVPPGTPNYGEPAYVSWKDQPYAARVEEAKQLLSAAGYSAENPLTFTLSYNTSENHKRIAVAVASMWKEIGVKAELFNSEVKVHYDSLKTASFDVARAGWIADYPDPQNFLFLLETKSGSLNYGQYSNANFDTLMEKAAVTSDLSARASLLFDAEAQAMADQPVIPIYYYVSKNLVSQKVKGWVANTRDVHHARYMDLM